MFEQRFVLKLLFKRLIMLKAHLVLIIVVIIILFKNHFGNNKGIIFQISAVFIFYLKLLVVVYPISVFEDYPPILSLVLYHNILGFLVPPFILLYFNSYLNKSSSIKPVYYLLFVPFLFFSLNFIPYWGLSLSDKFQLFNHPNDFIPVKYYFLISWPVSTIISDFYNTALACLIFYIIFRHFASQKNLINKKTLSSLIQSWMLFGVYIFIIAVLKFPKYLNLEGYINTNIKETLLLIVPLTILLFPQFLFNISTNSDLTFYLRLLSNFSGNRDKTASLDEDIISDSAKILNYLHKDKAYLSPGFSKHDIVTHLDIPQKTVTDCFSKVIKIPFPKLRNQLRIEHATELFKNNVHLTKTISGIAIDSGFQNRASFYIAFKEVMKMTPIEWIKENCEFDLVEELEVASSVSK